MKTKVLQLILLMGNNLTVPFIAPAPNGKYRLSSYSDTHGFPTGSYHWADDAGKSRIYMGDYQVDPGAFEVRPPVWHH